MRTLDPTPALSRAYSARLDAQPEPNAHVHPLLRGVLNAFADTAFDAERSQELQAERLAEWRADDRESAQIERKEREA